ncbi:hypothetical protein ABK040_016631 [Willaertia magna]
MTELLKWVVGVGLDITMIIAPTIGYVDQFREINKRKSNAAFSKFISLILLVANILRIFFWMWKRFEDTLLYQSIVMIICQFLMLWICSRYPKSNESGTLFSKPIESFWNWIDFESYCFAMLFFTLFMTLLSFVCPPIFGSYQYSEMIGGIALFTEALLGIPQVIKNFKHGTEGLSVVLLGTFFLGDGFKTIYFIFKNAPIQFISCGVFQLFVDCILVYQYLTDKKKNKPILSH